jgi:hypothetical protein
MSDIHEERELDERRNIAEEYRRKCEEQGRKLNDFVRDEDYQALLKKLDDKSVSGLLMDAGLSHLRYIIEKHPDFAWPHAKLAERIKSIDEAIEAVRLDPEYKYAFDNVLNDLEAFYENFLDLSSLEPQLLEAIEKSPDNPILHFLLAEQYSHHSEKDELLQKAIWEFREEYSRENLVPE